MDVHTSLGQPVSFGLCLKAMPKLEGGERVIYCEPSNQATDLQGEKMLMRALQESRAYFLEKGNLDLEHYTIRGESLGLPNPRLYEIGRPVDVRFDDGRVFVKGVIYSGSGLMAQRANEFWESLTDMQPPMPWYPSVGGHIAQRGVIVPEGESTPVPAISAVYWNNIGFAREPVNPVVPAVSQMPLGVFAKSWIGTGSILAQDVIQKAIEAGNGTDLAQLTGGEALRGGMPSPGKQASLIHAICLKTLKQGGKAGSVVDRLVNALMQHGLDRSSAINGVAGFLREVSTRRGK